MSSEEKLDEAEAVKRLNEPLSRQYRSALQYSIVAASVKGLEGQALGAKLTEFGDAELSGARRLIEKVVALGGEPSSEVASLRFDPAVDGAISWLVRCEEEAVEALQAAIEPTGRDGRSEALEHMLEHEIMRKQEQVDFLRRALDA